MSSSVTQLLLSPGSVDSGKVGRGSGASRSTSAGSSKPASKPASPGEQRLYAMNVPGLPEYDYPAPWSQDTHKLPEIDYPVPFMVKNTFIGAHVGRPSSLEGFFEDRQTQSCPVSGISLPPGLEDLVEPEEAAARFVAIEAAHRREAEFQSTSTFGLPYSQFEGFPDTPFCSQTPQFLPPATQQLPFDFRPFDAPGLPPLMVSPNQARPLPILLDSLLAAQSPPQSKQSPYFNAQFNEFHPTPAPPAWAAQHDEALPEPELGSPECPTIGSKAHFYGTCKPCAFLYTKGCSNGASCPFCHLCDAGEKKRRSKDKRAVKQNARRDGASTFMHL